jgi:hypothetical protein
MLEAFKRGLRHFTQRLRSKPIKTMSNQPGGPDKNDPGTPQYGLEQHRIDKETVKSFHEQSLAEDTTKSPTRTLAGPTTSIIEPPKPIPEFKLSAHDPNTEFTEKFAVSWAPSGYPYQTVGLVQSGSANTIQHTGTGVLVGRNLLLTSSQLAPWGQSAWWIRFAPGFNNGNAPFGWIYVERYYEYQVSTTTTNTPTANDYVICKLYTPVGDSSGWMGAEYFTSDTGYTGSTWSTLALMPWISYPAPLPTLVTDVKVDQVQDGPGDKLLLNAEFGPPVAGSQLSQSGWLGAPLFGPGLQPMVVGVFSGLLPVGGSSDSAWAGGMEMTQLISYAINNWAT